MNIKENGIEKSQKTYQALNISRRSFSRIGAVAPVIMSLASRPAFGVSCTVSGHLSATPANFSGVARHFAIDCGASAMNSDEWFIDTGSWPGGLTPASTVFDAFNVSGGLYYNQTLGDVLSGVQGDDVTRSLIAALFNAQTGRYSSMTTGVLDSATVIDMYTQLSNTSSYTAAAGVFWDGATVDAFLQQTF